MEINLKYYIPKMINPGDFILAKCLETDYTFMYVEQEQIDGLNYEGIVDLSNGILYLYNDETREFANVAGFIKHEFCGDIVDIIPSENIIINRKSQREV
jgi:hypothetical protein